jgi:hypothetical protein
MHEIHAREAAEARRVIEGARQRAACFVREALAARRAPAAFLPPPGAVPVVDPATLPPLGPHGPVRVLNCDFMPTMLRLERSKCVIC